MFLAKEILMICGASRLLKRFKFVVYSVWSGKIATVILFVCIVAIMVFEEISQKTATIMMCVCIFFSLVALFNYLKMYAKVKESRMHKKESKE